MGVRTAGACLLLLTLAGCRSKPPAECAAFRDRFLVCARHDDRMTRAAADDLYEKCGFSRRVVAEGGQRTSYEDFFDDCLSTTDCEGVNACLTAHDCSFILSDPDDVEPALFCKL